MRKGVVLHIVLFLFLTPGATLALSGFISDQDGLGLTKALVEVEVDGEKYRSYTGAQGGFDFANLPDNRPYLLRVNKSGYSENARVGNTSDLEEVRLQLQVQMVTLGLTVMTREGEPLQGVLIDGGDLGLQSTDVNGKVSFFLPYGSEYELNATLADYYFRNSISGVLQGDVERVLAGELD